LVLSGSMNSLMNLFTRKTPQQETKDLAKDANKQVRSDQRELNRELQRLKRKEAECEAKIKAAAKQPGGAANAKPLVRALLEIREQIKKLTTASAKVGSVGATVQAMATSSTIAGTIAHTSKAMGSMNKAMDHAKVGETMAQFSQQSDQMAIKEQMVDEAFEALDGDVDWEAEDETLAMVMDELGLEVAGTMSAVPKTQAAAAARSQSQPAAAQLGVADFS
jgi:division protein CdvB (Snf7/Vps24/ESCRT-III family)